MLLAENGFLLLIGILIGTVSALIAVAPHLITPGAQAPWSSLVMTLVSVFLVGMAASAIAVYFALRRPLLPALKTRRLICQRLPLLNHIGSAADRGRHQHPLLLLRQVVEFVEIVVIVRPRRVSGTILIE